MQDRQPRLAVLASGLSFSFGYGATKFYLRTVPPETLSEFLRDQSRSQPQKTCRSKQVVNTNSDGRPDV